MQIIINLLLGLAMIAIGLATSIKSEWFLNNFGRMEFFEAKMGTYGGSRLGYKLIGLAFIFIGVLTATGLIGSFITWVLGPLIRLGNPNVNSTINTGQ